MYTNVDQLVFLGVDSQSNYFGIQLSEEDAVTLNCVGVFKDLKQVAVWLSQEESSLLAYTRAMMYWHQQHTFCGICGSLTKPGMPGMSDIVLIRHVKKNIFRGLMLP